MAAGTIWVSSEKQDQRQMIRWNESEDDMKISHAVSKADSDEEMIQTGDMRAGADDPGSEETKSVKMKKTPRQPSQREREEHERTHLPFRDWCRGNRPCTSFSRTNGYGKLCTPLRITTSRLSTMR